MLEAINAYKVSATSAIGIRKGSEFQELRTFKKFIENMPEEKKKPFTIAFLKKNNPSEAMAAIIHEFVTGKMNAGEALSSALVLDELNSGDRKAAVALLTLCNTVDNKHGVVSSLRTQHLKGYTSIARKKMFCMDYIAHNIAIGHFK